MDRHAHRYAFCEHEGRPHITAREKKNPENGVKTKIYSRERERRDGKFDANVAMTKCVYTKKTHTSDRRSE